MGGQAIKTKIASPRADPKKPHIIAEQPLLGNLWPKNSIF
jgi:hypothetical protein